MIHPWTIFLTSEMQAAARALQGKPKDPIGALEHLFTVQCNIEAEDRDMVLYNKIKKEPYRIHSAESNRQRARHMRTSMPAYWKWYDQTAQLLIKKGYISGEKYNTVMPTAGDKKSGKQDYDPIPAEMANVVREK